MTPCAKTPAERRAWNAACESWARRDERRGLAARGWFLAGLDVADDPAELRAAADACRADDPEGAADLDDRAELLEGVESLGDLGLLEVDWRIGAFRLGSNARLTVAVITAAVAPA